MALALPAGADAHARLVGSIPADRTVSTTPPRQVVVTFDDPVSVGPGNAVVRQHGGSVLAGAPRTHGRSLVLPLRPGLRDGDYSVRWSVISDDGHLEEGVLAFGVGSGPPPTPTLRAETRVSVAMAVTRWLFLSALMTTAGLALFGLVVLRRFPLRDGSSRWLASGQVLVCATAIALVWQSGGGLSTRFGLAMSAGALVAAVGAGAAAVSRFRPGWAWLASGAALALLLVPTPAGHALDAGRSWVDVPVDLLHLVGVAFWFGSLVGLAVIVPRLDRPPGHAAATARRFSRLAVVAVVLIALTGVGRAFQELRSIDQAWTTSYGVSLLVKTGIFVLLVALAWVSRSKLAAGYGKLRTSVAGEIVGLLAVLAAVGVLTSLPPGRSIGASTAVAAPAARVGLPPLPPPDAVVAAQRDGRIAAAIAVTPTGRATATFIGPDLGAADVGRVAIDGRAATSCGVGCYSGTASPTGVVSVKAGNRGLRFVLGTPRPAAGLVARLAASYRGARSVVYEQRIATGLAPPLRSRWVEVAPASFSYRIAKGAEAIVIGTHRWDRDPGGQWKRSQALITRGPTPLWGGGPIANVHILSRTRTRFVVSFLGASPSYPAWFTVEVDRRTLHLVRLQMTAAAHFMDVRYLSWDQPIALTPPGP